MSISSGRRLTELSPEMLEILKKVAEQVATKGDAFEQKILRSQANNPQYEFLLPTSKHHDYYLKVLHQEVIKKGIFLPLLIKHLFILHLFLVSVSTSRNSNR